MADPALDPGIAAMLDAAAAQAATPYEELGAAGARAAFRQAVEAGHGEDWAPEPVHRVEDREISGPGGQIPLRVYWPRVDAAVPVVVYFHGGGWVIGDRDTHDAQARLLCNGAHAIVVSVDYRLAPEHRYPAAFEDAVAAVRWASANAEELGGDAARLAVAGDSAGGNLAAAVCLWARDQGGPAIRAQCLIYPVTDLRPDQGSWVAFGSGYNLDGSSMEWFNRNYAPDPATWDEPYLAPLRAPDVSGLPPAIVATASHDILRDQGEAYAARLRDAGGAVFARRYEGLVHSFFRHGEVSGAARAANQEICERLRALLHD